VVRESLGHFVVVITLSVYPRNREDFEEWRPVSCCCQSGVLQDDQVGGSLEKSGGDDGT
jgi:hypothetical protein